MNIVERLSENERVNESSSALRRIGDAVHQSFVSSEVDQSAAREQPLRSQSSAQTFGLAATTVFLVMLILNAVSY
jgi:hypothetical protein